MGSTIIPGLRYRDAKAAITWLGQAFGFEEHLVVPDGEGGIAHAQLMRGSAMVMLGSKRADDFSAVTGTPEDTGGKCTMSAYLVVKDADAVRETALAAGAKIVRDIQDEDYGGRGFSCLDLEGNLWHFGTYDPWAEPAGG